MQSLLENVKVVSLLVVVAEVVAVYVRVRACICLSACLCVSVCVCVGKREDLLIFTKLLSLSTHTLRQSCLF